MDDTHDPQRRSWVHSANLPGAAFPIQNLPFGVFAGAAGPTVGVAIGDQILELRGLDLRGCEVCAAGNLNSLMALGPASWAQLRVRLSDLIKDGDIDANVAMAPGDILIIPQTYF